MFLSSVIAALANGSFVHIIDGVERAFIDATDIEEYIRGLEPALFASLAANPQIAPVQKVITSVFSEAQAAVTALDTAAHAVDPLAGPAPAPSPSPQVAIPAQGTSQETKGS